MKRTDLMRVNFFFAFYLGVSDSIHKLLTNITHG